MKKYNYTTLILAALLIVFSLSSAWAQEEMPVAPNQNSNQKPRPNLLAELNLNQNQIQQIRRINQESKLKKREAQLRVVEAQKALDDAIYADVADEAEIQNRLRTLQLAQTEIINLRSMTEFAVRQILTSEQLVRFREVRRKFMEEMENRRIQKQNRPFRNPNKQFNNRQRRLRSED